MSCPLLGLLASLANIDSTARLRLSVSMIFAVQAGRAQQRSWKRKTPHRNGAVTAKRAKRSAAAA